MNLDQNNQTLPPETLHEKVTIGMLAAVAVVLVSLVTFVFTDAHKTTKEPQVAAVVTAQDFFSSLSLEARAAIVLDVKSGKVLFAREPDKQLPLASLTKVPTAYVVAESLPLETSVQLINEIPATVTANPLQKGSRMTIQELLDYTLAASSNEGAELLAYYADSAVRIRFPEAPEGRAVIWRMNTLAKERGLTHTFFTNVSGLDIDATTAGSYGSVRDVATLFAYIGEMRPDVFARTNDAHFAVGSASVGNTNEALSFLSGLIVGKTGYTDLAGGNLAVVFDAGPARPVAIVVLGSSKEGRFEDMKKLVEATRMSLSQ